MSNILRIIYMSVLFLFSLLFIIYHVREWIIIMTKRKRGLEKEPEKPSEPEPAVDVVGKSTTVFLAPLPPAGMEPLMSEDLETEMKSEAETEPDIKPEEVEVNFNTEYIPDQDELIQYPNDDIDTTGYLSQGLSYEQISHAVDVVQGKNSDENDEVNAGETLCIMPSDFLDIICTHVDHGAMVKKLIAGYLDFSGKMKPVSVLIENFDINQYV